MTAAALQALQGPLSTSASNIRSTGFSRIDRLITGFRPGELVIVAGDWSSDRFSFINTMLRHIAMDLGKTSLYFLPREYWELFIREDLFANNERLTVESIQKEEIGTWNWKQITEDAKNIQTSPMFLFDCGNYVVQNITKYVHQFSVTHSRPHLTVITYGHLRSHRAKLTWEDELIESVRMLKVLALKANAAVILPCAWTKEDLLKSPFSECCNTADTVLYLNDEPYSLRK